MFKGSIVAIITPFKDGKIDEETYRELIEFQIENGTNAIVPCGTTGESATLSMEEHSRVIDIAIKAVNKRVPVIAGTGGNNTTEAIELTKHAKSAGADASLQVTPYYNKPSQEGLYQHYKALASAVEIPVLLYNVPGRTAVDLLPETIYRLFNECSNVYGVKEATGSIERCVDLLAHEPKLSVISGDDAINYPILSNGGNGVISVTSNLMPNKIADLTHAAINGDYHEAKRINDALYTMNKILFCESNPIPIKAAMYIAGLLDTLEYRLPLTPPSKENMKKIEEVIKQYDIKGF